MKNGQSLIEVLVAVGVATLLGIALVSTAVLTQKTSRSTQNTAYATKLAQEMVEQLRIFRDQSRNKLEAFPFYASLDPNYSICYTITSTKNPDGSLKVTQSPQGNLQWIFTAVPVGLVDGLGVTCPALTNLPSSNAEGIRSASNVTFYRYVLFRKDGTGGAITGTVSVSWQEQAGWRTISNDVYLTKWCDPSTGVCM